MLLKHRRLVHYHLLHNRHPHPRVVHKVRLRSHSLHPHILQLHSLDVLGLDGRLLLHDLERILVALVDLVDLGINSYVANLMLSDVGGWEIVGRRSGRTCGLVWNVPHFGDRDVCEVRVIGWLELTYPCFFKSTHRLFTDQSVDETASHWGSLSGIMNRVHFSLLLYLLLHLIFFILLLRFDLNCAVWRDIFESEQILVVGGKFLVNLWNFVGYRLVFVDWSGLMPKSCPQLSRRYHFFALIYYFHRLAKL